MTALDPASGQGGTSVESGAPHWPGEAAFWVFILGDMLAFFAFFVGFAWYRNAEPEVFRQGQVALNEALGLLNTFLLLASSWFVVIGEKALKTGRWRQSSPFFLLAIACAVAFCVVKYFEYSGKIAEGFTPVSNTFFAFYYGLTGIHLFHVVMAIAFLSIIAIPGREPSQKSMVGIECAAVFWHLVDLLWIFLFTLIYLMV